MRAGLVRTVLGVAAVGAMVLPVTSVPPAGASNAPDAIVAGRPHTMRLRPVLAEVPPPVRRAVDDPTLLAACATTDPTAYRRVRSAARDTDPTSTCIVADGASREPRRLLGPATITGSDLDWAASDERGVVTLQFMESRGSAVSDFLAQSLPGGVALTVDGSVVAVLTSDTVRIAPETDGPSLDVVLPRGTSRSDVRELVASISATEHEQLIGLLAESTMTTRARRLVASTDARVLDKAQFVGGCKALERPQTFVLGCFRTSPSMLRVLRVDRPELRTVMVVSTAHEMLHAAYAGLALDDRKQIDAMLDAADASFTDARLKALLSDYETFEPGQRHNELHSLLATQVESLSPELEQYYRRYFVDRQQVVRAFRQYDGVFVGLIAQRDALKAELDGVRVELDSASSTALSLSRQIDTLRAQGRIAESNALVAPQNAAASRSRALAAQHNELVARYNALVASGRELYEALGYTPATPVNG